MRCLLLHEADIKYDSLLKQHHVEPYNLPVLETTLLKQHHVEPYNLPVLETTLLDTVLGEHAVHNDLKSNALDSLSDALSPFDGVIVTSKHGAAFLQANKINLCERAVGVVGPSTGRLVEDYIRGSAGPRPTTVLIADNASDLADQIIATFPRSLSWVYLCGNKSLDVLPEKMEGEGIGLHRMEVYHVGKKAGLDSALLAALSRVEFNVAVFFSPSGVYYTATLLSQHLSSSCVLVAFGKSTAAAVDECFGGKFTVRVCRRPTPQSLCETVLAKPGDVDC